MLLRENRKPYRTHARVMHVTLEHKQIYWGLFWIFRNFILFGFCLFVCSLVKAYIAYICSTLSNTNYQLFSCLSGVHQLVLGEFLQSITKMELCEQNAIPRFYSAGKNKMLISQETVKKNCQKKKKGKVDIFLALSSENLGNQWIKYSVLESPYLTLVASFNLCLSMNKKWISNLVC